MKLILTSSVLLAIGGAPSVSAFAPVLKPSVAHCPQCSSPLSMSTTSEDVEATVNKKDRRRKIMQSPSFYRRGFKEQREGVEETMAQEYESDLVKDLKGNDFVVERNNVRVHLAKDFGFCWGVERSIALAYEAVNHFPDRNIHITNELIHNPEVNDKLANMDVKFIEKLEGGGKRFETVQDNDVVILPAFGASLEEMDMFDQKNVEVVDTTCPWVSKVWNTVDMHQKKGLTSVIHGKYAHEETVATLSFCEDYIVAKDMNEAQMVADYITGEYKGTKEEFLEHFKNAISVGFDPDVHLIKVGLANQTTMYKKETRAIGQLLQKSMMAKYGPVDAAAHYVEFDTICDATQERQDAVQDLTENIDELGLEFILVVGGWDSSNTAHLLEIPHKAGVTAYHINRAECITADNKITHRLIDGEIVTEKFLPDGHEGKMLKMGITSGASTPDAAVQESLTNIFMLKEVMDAKMQLA